MLRGCVTWLKVPGMKPFALPMAQIPVQIKEGPGCLVIGVFQDISRDLLLGDDCVSLGQDPSPAPVTAKDLNLNPGNKLAETEVVNEIENDLAGRGEELLSLEYLPACNQSPGAEWDREILPTSLHMGEVAHTGSDTEKLPELIDLARENLARAQGRQKVWYDCSADGTRDQVRVLILVKTNKLQGAWDGPFKVIQQLNEENDVVELPNWAHSHRGTRST
ncbi:uncharacterized protein LOC122466557 [Chelonia mydas]|uniref:uncharacterized protein LOC122466557 n=1 Tax=Chelonia mydas TaxID=8469 RepID=UPI001CAA183F|nr:uncharacterized protein LOC122466557 [Chelonia mydas]